MPPASVFAGAPFRTALLTLAVFVPALVLVGATLHRSLGDAMLGELESQVVAELVLLREIVEEGGQPALIEAVRRMERSGASEPRLTGLFDTAGKRLAGDVDVAPAFVGWRTIELARDTDAEHDPYLTRVERWRRSTLVVGRSTRLVERTLATLVRDLLIAGALVTALCLGIGYVASRRTRDKLARVAATLDRVSSGETRARLPIGRTNDQIDHVSRQINEHLERLNLLMETLLNTSGAIAHDLRTPLARASLGLQEVLADPTLDARHAELLEGTAHELDELGEIVATVLRIAHIEASDDTHDFLPVPLGRLATDIGEMFRPVAEERGQTLETRTEEEAVPEGGPHVLGDERMLRRLLVNLVENAIRHCPSGTHIRIETRSREDGGVTLVVQDDGSGIPAAERERVLEPFARLDASRTTVGTGLGLALGSAVARRHGTRLMFEDAAPGLRVIVEFR